MVRVPPLSGSITKKARFFMCVFPYAQGVKYSSHAFLNNCIYVTV